MDESTTDVLKALLASVIRHALTAGGLLTTVSAADQGTFASVAAGVVMMAAGLAWSGVQKLLTHNKLAAAQAAPAQPAAPVVIPK